MVFIEDSGVKKEKGLEEETPEYLKIDTWKKVGRWTNNFCKKIAERMGYQGRIAAGKDRTPADSIAKPITVKTNNQYSIETSYVKIDTTDIESTQEFLETTVRGILRGLQFQELEGIIFNEMESLKNLYAFLDGQSSKFFGDNRSTEDLYREAKEDQNFSEESIDRAMNNYIIGSMEINIEKGRDQKDKKIKYPVAIRNKDELYNVNEYLEKQFRNEIERFSEELDKHYINIAKIHKYGSKNAEKGKIAKSVNLTMDQLKEINDTVTSLKDFL